MIYVGVLLSLFAVVPFGTDRGRPNTGLLVGTLVLLFLFVGFRWEVGCDWTGYLNIFEITRNASLQDVLTGREPAFGVANFLLHVFAWEYFWINVIGALFFFVGLYFFARREENPLAVVALSFPVLIINMPITAVRQGIAIGLFMIAINAYRDRNRWGYVAAVLAASGFHQSALVFLGLAPLIGVRKTAVTVAFAAILALPAMYVLLTETVGFYTDRYVGGPDEAAGALFRAALLGATGLIFLTVLRKRWWREHPDDYELYLIGAVLMIAVIPTALFSSVIGDRLGYYLIPLQVVMLARLPSLLRSDSMAPVYAILPYVTLFVFFVAWTSLSSLFALCYLPYKSVLLGV